MTPLIMKDCWYHSGNKLLEMKPLIASESCISCKCILILSTVVGPAFIIFPCQHMIEGSGVPTSYFAAILLSVLPND